MFKPFFVHEHKQPGKMSNRGPRGFTVFVGPDPHVRGNILVSAAWCSPKDQFVKRLGREQARNAFPVSMKATTLPKYISECFNTLWEGPCYNEHSFYYLFKRML